MVMCYCSDMRLNGAPPPYYPTSSSDSNASDSGVSDSPKPPKRVIHEVLV